MEGIKMKKISIILCNLVFLLGFTVTVNSTVVIDPSLGWSGTFDWDDGLGQIDGIEFGSDIDWSVTVGSDSIMSVITATDDFVPGDEFALYFDGLEIPWTSESTVSGGYFQGQFDDLFLTAGVHTFTLFVTSLAPDPAGGTFLSGAAQASFSAVRAASDPVPEPGTVLLMGAGLLGLVGYNRRRSANKNR